MSCCQFEAVATKAYVNILVQDFCGCVFSLIFGKYLEMELLGQKADVCWNLLNSSLKSTKHCLLYILSNI